MKKLMHNLYPQDRADKVTVDQRGKSQRGGDVAYAQAFPSTSAPTKCQYSSTKTRRESIADARSPDSLFSQGCVVTTSARPNPRSLLPPVAHLHSPRAPIHALHLVSFPIPGRVLPYHVFPCPRFLVFRNL